MTNSQVFAAFARKQPGEGHSVRSVRTSEGVVLYSVVLSSYSTPIAYYRDDMNTPVFTTRRFSVTTSKQQSQARAVFDMINTVDPDQFVPMAKAAGANFSFAR